MGKQGMAREGGGRHGGVDIWRRQCARRVAVRMEASHGSVAGVGEEVQQTVYQDERLCPLCRAIIDAQRRGWHPIWPISAHLTVTNAFIPAAFTPRVLHLATV